MFELTRRNNNHQVKAYNPFREMEELERKLNRLRSMNKPSCNYNKLNAKLHPMAYWRGDNSDDVIFTEEGDDE